MQCTISFQMSMQTIIYQRIISMCLFQILQQTLKFDFSMFSKRQSKCFWKKSLLFTFQKELSLYQWESRKSNHKESSNNNPINSFNESKKQRANQWVFSMQTKMFFQTNKQMRKTKHLTLNQSLVLSQSDTLNPRSQREWNCQWEPRNERQATKGKKNLETLKLFKHPN